MMDTPPPPRDSNLRNIIDKLAEFVARNGPEFEMITKQKQHGNPKFDFLYGGEFASYYQYRVAAEQAFLKQQNPAHLQTPAHQIPHHHQTHPTNSPAVPNHYSQPPPGNQIHMPQQQQQQGLTQNSHDSNTFNMNMQQPPPTTTNSGTNAAINYTGQIEAINMQQNTLREQIHQSESNLTAQHSAMMTQQAKQVEEAIEKAQNTQLEKESEDNSIVLRDYDAILQPIIESCTKDSISAGKNWILQHSSDSAKSNVVLQYLLKKALLNGSTFQQKLHLIYLVNDILHHCVRKNCHDLKNSLENVVIPMFCSADLIANTEQRAKLTKLLSLWEQKAKFFDACVISKLQSPDSSMQEYKTNLQNKHQDIVSKFTQNTKATLDNYQKQHQIFVQHATQQITQLEQQKQQLEQQMLATVLPNAATMLPITQTSVLPQQQQQQQQSLPLPQQQPQHAQKIPSLMAQKISMPDNHDQNEHIKPPGVDDNNYGNVMSNNNNNNNNRSHHYQQPFDNNNMSYGQTVGAQQSNYATLDQLSQQQQQIQQQQQKSVGGSGAGFFIPDMSKPPPGFAGGGGIGAGNMAMNQMQTGLQQQQQQQPQPAFGQINNIPHNASLNNSSGVGVGAGSAGVGVGGVGSNADSVNLNAPAAANIDVLALNAAIQLVLKQQQLQNPQHPNLDTNGQLQSFSDLQSSQAPSLTQMPQMQPPHLMLDNNNGEMPQPPVGFMQPPQIEMMEEQMPSAPYYDLPAGLMVPLIRLDDYNYKPLDPADIRLPPPAPQSERLTNALAAFYAPPTHDRPRDTEGWEKLGLYEYYKVKNAARKQKEEEIEKGEREKSRSPSPILIEKPKTKKIKKRCYRSRSRSRSRTRSPHRSSPPPPRSSSSRRSNRYKQRSRSPRKSPQRERNDRDRDRDRDSASTSRDSRPDRGANPRRERSVTPPSFIPGNMARQNEFIDESNRGHQMLKKMGWAGSGAGLGSKHQGIDQPIPGGEVRDRNDMYKGVGINLNDPFENFRKNKGAAFVHRMRSRDEKS